MKMTWLEALKVALHEREFWYCMLAALVFGILIACALVE